MENRFQKIGKIKDVFLVKTYHRQPIYPKKITSKLNTIYLDKPGLERYNKYLEIEELYDNLFPSIETHIEIAKIIYEKLYKEYQYKFDEFSDLLNEENSRIVRLFVEKGHVIDINVIESEDTYTTNLKLIEYTGSTKRKDIISKDGIMLTTILFGFFEFEETDEEGVKIEIITDFLPLEESIKYIHDKYEKIYKEKHNISFNKKPQRKINRYKIGLMSQFPINGEGFQDEEIRDGQFNINIDYNENNITIYSSIKKSNYKIIFDLSYLFSHGLTLINIMFYQTRENLKDLIINLYLERGYVFNYYYFVNPDHPMYMASQGKIPLQPDTFEVAAIPLKNYTEKLNYIKNNEHFNFKREEFFPNLGWRKKDMIEALKKTGFVKVHIIEPKANEEKMLEEQVISWRLRYLIGAEIEQGYKTKYDVPSFLVDQVNFSEEKREKYRQIDINKWKENYLTISLGDLGVKPTKKIYWSWYFKQISKYSASELVALCRYFLSSLTYVNWDFLCQKRFVDFAQLKRIARQEFYIKTEGKKYEEVCNEISLISEQRRNIKDEIIKAIPFANEILLYNPGTNLVEIPTRVKFRKGKNAIIDPIEQYNTVVEYCEDRNVSKKDLIEAIVEGKMDYIYPYDFNKSTKDEICEYYQDYLEFQTEKFGGIELDCSNNHIRKIHILNAIELMGLSSILPENVKNMNKRELCEMIDKYIQILKNTK